MSTGSTAQGDRLRGMDDFAGLPPSMLQPVTFADDDDESDLTRVRLRPITAEEEQADEDSEACSHCDGEPYMQECDDPIQCCDPHCDGTWHPCVACDGTGLAVHQWSW